MGFNDGGKSKKDYKRAKYGKPAGRDGGGGWASSGGGGGRGGGGGGGNFPGGSKDGGIWKRCVSRRHRKYSPERGGTKHISRQNRGGRLYNPYPIVRVRVSISFRSARQTSPRHWLFLRRREHATRRARSYYYYFSFFLPSLEEERKHRHPPHPSKRV